MVLIDHIQPFHSHHGLVQPSQFLAFGLTEVCIRLHSLGRLPEMEKARRIRTLADGTGLKLDNKSVPAFLRTISKASESADFSDEMGSYVSNWVATGADSVVSEEEYIRFIASNLMLLFRFRSDIKYLETALWLCEKAGRESISWLYSSCVGEITRKTNRKVIISPPEELRSGNKQFKSPVLGIENGKLFLVEKGRATDLSEIGDYLVNPRMNSIWVNVDRDRQGDVAFAMSRLRLSPSFGLLSHPDVP